MQVDEDLGVTDRIKFVQGLLDCGQEFGFYSYQRLWKDLCKKKELVGPRSNLAMN